MAHSVQKVVARCELAIGGAPSPEKEIPEELEQNQDSSPSANSGTKTRPESENEAGLSSASSATSLTQHEGRKGVLGKKNTFPNLLPFSESSFGASECHRQAKNIHQSWLA